MGQSQSLPYDLLNEAECSSHRKVIVVAFQPIYLISATRDQETKLETGNRDLNDLVDVRIQRYINSLSQLISQALNFQTLATMRDTLNIYVTLEKLDQSIFLQTDCDAVRLFFKEYNQLTHTPILITEKEASQSPFFDDLGDIRLGFLISQSIEYL